MFDYGSMRRQVLTLFQNIHCSCLCSYDISDINVSKDGSNEYYTLLKDGQTIIR